VCTGVRFLDLAHGNRKQPDVRLSMGNRLE
jgi:hypothetical protein